jgi:hypothetical protein
VSKCTRRDTPPHWLGNEVKDQDAQPSTERELPLVEAKARRIVYACCTNSSVKAVSDSHANSYNAGISTLFCTKRQMSVLSLSTARAVIQDCARSGSDVRRWPQGEVQQAFLPGGQTSQGSTASMGTRAIFGGSLSSKRDGACRRGCPRDAPPGGEVECEALSHYGGASSASWAS